MMRVGEVMTRDVAVVSPRASLREAARKMDQMNVGALPVCDGRRLVGILTDRDITVRATSAGGRPEDTRVHEIMTDDVRWCFEDDSLEEAEREMAEVQVRRLPVVDRGKRLVGIVTLGDLAADRAPGTEVTLRRISEPAEPDRSGGLSARRAAETTMQGSAGSTYGTARGRSRGDDHGGPSERSPRGEAGFGDRGLDRGFRYGSGGYGAESYGRAYGDAFGRGYAGYARRRAPAMESGAAESHRGRGPRGYRRSDDRIREDVNEGFMEDPDLDATNIEVAVSACEVTLTGSVGSRYDKRRAEDLAESVSGVTHVQNNLRIVQDLPTAGAPDMATSGSAGRKPPAA